MRLSYFLYLWLILRLRSPAFAVIRQADILEEDPSFERDNAELSRR